MFCRISLQEHELEWAQELMDSLNKEHTIIKEPLTILCDLNQYELDRLVCSCGGVHDLLLCRTHIMGEVQRQSYREMQS